MPSREREREAEQRTRKELELLNQILALYERERRLVAYEIHDGFAQMAAAALFRLEAFPGQLDADKEAAWRTFQEAMELLGQSVAEARRLIHGLRPPILETSGVVAAVEGLVSEQKLMGGPRVEFTADVRFDRLPAPLENAIFRIVQEGMANAVRHSQSEKVAIRLVQKGDQLRIEVRDWGVGFALEKVPPGRFGLEGIRQRAQMFGGRLIVESEPGHGARIVVELPLAAGPSRGL